MPLVSTRFGPVSTACLLCILLVLLLPLTAAAGIICGHITDADTGSPIAGAGVFARQPDGHYAGALAVSDQGGDWCLNDLTPGTYTLEFRVDNYVTAYVNGVVVADDISDVPLTLSRSPLTFDPPWPNPATAGVRLRLHLTRSAPIELGIYDVRGRLIQSWAAGLVEVGSREYFWDGRDAAGRPAPAGLYFARVRSSNTETMRPLILTR